MLLAGLLIRLGAPNVDSAYDQKFLGVILIVLSLIPFLVVFILLIILVTKSVSQREVMDAKEAIDKADQQSDVHRRRGQTTTLEVNVDETYGDREISRSRASTRATGNPLHSSEVPQRRADQQKRKQKRSKTTTATTITTTTKERTTKTTTTTTENEN